MTWDDLTFRCTECPVSFTSESLRLHAVRVDLHLSVHELAEIGEQLAGLAPDEALAWAADMARAVVLGAPRVSEVLLPGVTVTLAAG